MGSYKQLLIIFAVLLVTQASCQQIFTRRFQLALNLTLFDDDDRQNGIDEYFSSWSEASGVDYTSFSTSESIRQRTYSNVDKCNPMMYVEQQDYLWGDLEGQGTIELHSKTPFFIPLEAVYQPFIPSEEYQNQYVWDIQYEIHPCGAVFRTYSKILTNIELQDFQICSDVEEFFPDAFGKTDQFVNNDRERAWEFIIVRSGTYLGKQLDLELTLKYNTYENAIGDVDPASGWFSFIMYNDAPDFSAEQTENGVQIYEYLLEELAMPRQFSPCDDDDINVSHFFHASYLVSSSSTLTVGTIFMLFVLLIIC